MISAFSFLTVFGSGATPDHRSMRWFPLVGAVVGALVGTCWWGAGHVASPLLAAALAVAIDLIVTGLLHVDGLADASDGLLPHMSVDKRLAVMKEPTTGAFGFTVVAMVLLLRVSALSAQTVSPLLVIGLWTLARSMMVIVALTLPSARPGSISALFIGPGQRRTATLAAAGLGLAGGAALVIVGRGWLGLAVVGCAIGAAGAVAALARRRVGGFTGDVLGALGVVAETVGLIVAATQW